MADPVLNKTVTEHTSPSSAGQFEVVTPQPPTYKEQGHIRSEHPELLENVDEPLRQCQPATETDAGPEEKPKTMDNDRPPYGKREANAFIGTDPCKNDGNTRQHGGEQLQEMAPSARQANLDAQGDTEMMTDDDSSESLPEAPDNAKLDHEIGTCRHCNTPLEKKEIEALCPARERKTAGKLRIQRNSDDSKEKDKLIAEVKELKERIHALEETMDRIERPLLKIIERLS